MSEFVVATAGHVDHGKSALVRALTGIETDRWAEEKRRGLTIDLGYAWTTLPSGAAVSFVDVPGHERFLGNMLAGIGPAPVVCFVVAADEGWKPQSSDHRDALAALGIDRGVIVVTRSDLAPGSVPEVIAEARRELAGTGLAEAPALGVSALTGSGLPELRTALDAVLAGTRPPAADARIRLWIDRSFTMDGAGTVVTGTLAAGTVSTGDRLELCGRLRSGPVDVRGLQSRGRAAPDVTPTARTALNLRGVSADEVHRGDALLTPGAWWTSAVLDIRAHGTDALPRLPDRVTVHLGTAAVPARLRPFDDRHGRLTLERVLPVTVGDRIILRDPGSAAALLGAQLLDVDPPELDRRGAGARRARALSTMPPEGDLRTEVERRGALSIERARRLGIAGAADLEAAPGTAPVGPPAGVVIEGGLLVAESALERWGSRLRSALDAEAERDPLSAGMPFKAAADLLDLPADRLLGAVVAASGLSRSSGRVVRPGPVGLGAAERPVAELEDRLRAAPFSAPEADDLARLGLGSRELAAAENRGRLLRLADGVVLLPAAPAQAMRVLAGLDQPFTASDARQALGTTRRVAIPLLEHLDDRGWTRRIDSGRRVVVR